MKKDEGSIENPAPKIKPNPFGEAKARDENEYLKKKHVREIIVEF